MPNVYETITARIIAALESGVIPWRKEWTSGATDAALPTNFVTRKPYRGINVWTLFSSQYTSNFWMTYKQAQSIGAQVRKGEKSAPVVFWKIGTREDADTGEDKTIAFARFYHVFNIEQCDGIPVALPFDRPAFDPIEDAARIADGYFARTGAPSLAHGGARAFYAPGRDAIQMPVPESFTAPANYYHTLYHEMAHSTGHDSRLDRKLTGAGKFFGSEEYSKEELVAEFSASYLSAHAGIASAPLLDNAAAYIANWMSALKSDSTLALSAAQKAQKAADYMLGTTFAEDHAE